MKKLITILLLLITLSSCATVSLNWPKTAREEGWAPVEETTEDVLSNIPEPEEREKPAPLPKPEIPVLEVTDEDGNPIELDIQMLMRQVLLYGGTIDKFKYLVEIYEREYTNRDAQEGPFPEKTTDELMKEYLELIGVTLSSDE